MAEETKGNPEDKPEDKRNLALAAAITAVVWLLVLIVLALYPFFFRVNLHQGVFPSGYGMVWSLWSLLGLPVAVLNLVLAFTHKLRVASS